MKSLKLNGKFDTSTALKERCSVSTLSKPRSLDLGSRRVDLKATLFCGQAFRWEKRQEWFYGIVGDKILRLRQEGTIIYYSSSDNIGEGEIIKYLGIDLDLERVLKVIDRDKEIHSAILFCKGLRILRQEPWEVFASYILSSYNNILRIRRMVYNISQKFGRQVLWDGYVNYTFPTVEQIAGANERKLNSCGLGFRSRYLKNSAKQILKEKFSFFKLQDLSYEETKESLLRFDGIGEKVADCIMLFGLSRLDAFPVDVWIKRGIEKIYFKGRGLNLKKINEFGRGYFGGYAGYAQEYLYHYLRNTREC